MSRVLRQSPKAHFHQPELALDHPERLLHPRADACFALFNSLDIGDAQYGGYAMGDGMGGGGMMGGYGRGMMGGYGGGTDGGYGPGPDGRYEENRGQGPSELDSRAGRLFAQTCAQCHPLPDPRQHTARQWPGVIAGMEQHMTERNLPVPGDDAIKDIEAFLEQQTQGRQ